VGTVVIGFAGPDTDPEAERFTLFGGREGIRARAAQWALDYLRRRIQ
jgi:nicotinamide mononucleotide (NMN) deamidase PncC